MSLPGLIVDVEARIDKLERGLKRANTIQRNSSGQMERRAAQSAQRMRNSYGKAADGVAASLKKMTLPLLGGLLAAGTVKNMQVAVGQVASLGDEAKRAGVSLDSLQEWKFVGQQNRIGIDAIVDGLKELNLRSDEFILTKSGPAAEAFGRLGYSATDLKSKLKDPSELLLEIIGRLEDVDKAGQIRIADEIFGGSAGERFVELIGTGETGLRDMMQQARDTGAVLDADLIEKAQELDRRWAALTTRTSNWFKTFSVEAADAAVKIVTMRDDLDDMFRSSEQARSLLGDDVVAELEATTGAADENAVAIGQLRQRYEALGEQGNVVAQQLSQASNVMRSFGYEGQADTISDVARSLRELSVDMQDGTIDAETFETGMTQLTEQAQSAFAEIEAIDRVEFSGVMAGVDSLSRKLGEAIGFARTLRSTLPGADPRGETTSVVVVREVGSFWDDPANEELVNPATTAPVLTSPRPRSAPFEVGVPDIPVSSTPTTAGSGGASSRARPTKRSDYTIELEGIAQETAALQAEAQALLAAALSGEDYGDAIEFAQTKVDLLMAAQRSGLTITPELEAQITDLAAAQTRAGVAAGQAADRIREIQSAGREGAQAVTDIFAQMAAGTKTATQALGDLLLQMAKVALQKRLMALAETSGGAGNIIGFIGSALSGGFAEGGFTGRGGKYEPAGVVHRGEYVLSATATRQLGVRNLDALHHSALKGYASGGLVGSGTKAMTTAPTTTQAVNINAPVTINASGGTQAQNLDLAKQVTRQIEANMRGAIAKELRNHLRPGNMLNRG